MECLFVKWNVFDLDGMFVKWNVFELDGNVCQMECYCSINGMFVCQMECYCYYSINGMFFQE